MNFFTKIFKESIPFSQYKQERLELYNPPHYNAGTFTPYQPQYQAPTLQPGQTRQQLVAQAIAAHGAAPMQPTAAPAPMAQPMPAPAAPPPMMGNPSTAPAPVPQMGLQRDPRMLAAALRM